jgi:hypothetical protein
MEALPDESLNGAAAIAAALAIMERVSGHGARRVTGWATVELDRAARDLAIGVAVRSRDLSDDTLLGAHCRLVEAENRADVLLLEPATEGRLAASLARFDEGPVALYFLAPPDRFGEVIEALLRSGLEMSAEAPGPFGRERLVAGAPPVRLHLLIAEDTPNPPSSRAATIER